MKLPFSFFLALRYLKPKRTFVSIITLISMVGVMLGVTVLIVVISVMTGFDRELRQKVVDWDAHILVSSEDVLRDWRDLTVKIRNTPGVVGTAPYVQGPVIVELQEQRQATLIRGIDPVEEEKVVELKKFIKKGSLDLEGESAVLGVELARKLHIDVSDKLTVYSPGNLGEILDGMKELEKSKGGEERKAIDKLREVVLPKELTVTGIFETGHYLHDSEFLLVPIYVGQELYGRGEALHGITLGRYRNEFSHWLAETAHIEVFPKQVYQFSQLPAEVIPRDVAIICIGAFLICCLFAFLPAYRAARLDPVKALRYE